MTQPNLAAAAPTTDTGKSGVLNGLAKGLRRLMVSIKRKPFRANDPRAAQADAIFQTQRKPALEKTQYKCVFCTFRSQKYNEVHHGDDDHFNNQPENLWGICKLCHPYQHVGEAGVNNQSSGLNGGHLGPKALGLIRVPDGQMIPATDFNHLLRIVGVALSDATEREVALKVYDLFFDAEVRKEMAVAFYGPQTQATGVMPGDMAKALSLLTDDEYARRVPVLEPVRLLYSTALLEQVGRELKAEQAQWAQPAGWERLLEKQLTQVYEGEPGSPPAAAASASGEAADVSAILAAELASPELGVAADVEDDGESGDE